MELREFAKWNLVTIKKDENLETALKRMEAAKIRHLFVESENGILGVVSQSSIVKHLLHSEDKNTALDAKIIDLLEDHDNEIPATASLSEALLKMKSTQADCLVITSVDNKHGIITSMDMIEILRTVLNQNQTEDLVSQVEVELSNPLAQSVLKLLSDVGI